MSCWWTSSSLTSPVVASIASSGASSRVIVTPGPVTGSSPAGPASRPALPRGGGGAEPPGLPLRRVVSGTAGLLRQPVDLRAEVRRSCPDPGEVTGLAVREAVEVVVPAGPQVCPLRADHAGDEKHTG